MDIPSIYLDVCCLNRPYDDQSQVRGRIEAATVLVVLQHVERGEWRWVGSEAVADEIERGPDTDRRSRVQLLAARATVFIVGGPDDRERVRELLALGFG